MRRFQIRALLRILITPLPMMLWAQNPPQKTGISLSKSEARSNTSRAEPGAINNGIYHNQSFGFSYKLPYGWVDRTQEMQDDSSAASKSVLLLAIFERPPEATGDTINSAVVIAAEPLSAYSGVKTASDYFAPLTELATAKGFDVANQPYEFAVGSVPLVRADFSKPRGTLMMHQTSLVMLQKSYALSLTFIGSSDDEVSALIEKLIFRAHKRPQ